MENEGTDVGDEREREGGREGWLEWRTRSNRRRKLSAIIPSILLVGLGPRLQTDRQTECQVPTCHPYFSSKEDTVSPRIIPRSLYPTYLRIIPFFFLSLSLFPSPLFSTLVIRFTDLTLVRDVSYLSSSKTY